MAINRVVKSTLEKRSNYDRNRDRLGRVRKIGYSSRYKNQLNRGIGNTYKYSQYNRKLDVRKKIFKPYGRNNLSIMNRRYYNRGNLYSLRNNVGSNNNNRRIINRYEDKTGRNATLRRGDSYNRKPLATSYRNNYRDRNRRAPFKNNNNTHGGDRRVYYDGRKSNNRKLHGKIGKLSAKDLDAQLDAYMGANNVKSRLDNELDSYFKNNAAAQPAETSNN